MESPSLREGRTSTQDEDTEPSSSIRQRVVRTRQIQQERFAEHPDIHNSSQIIATLITRQCRPDHSGAALLKNAMERLDLSARAYDHILKVARTIADLKSQIMTSSWLRIPGNKHKG